MAKPKIQVMIVDDHKMFVEGVQAIFSNSSEIKIVETIFDGQVGLDTAIRKSLFEF